MIAAGNGRSEEVNLLIDDGADIYIRDRGRNDAMMWAVKQGHGEIAGLIVKRGFDRILKKRK